MPKNTLLFPPSFVFDTVGAESGISGLQIAVNNLAVASKSGAMRQAHALGVGGRNSIKNQNKGMPTLNSLLPTRSVGKYTVAPAEPSGTVGYFLTGYLTIGGLRADTTQDRFTFATNTLVNIGAFLYTSNCYSFANKTFGYFALISGFYRLTFQSELFATLGAILSPQRYVGASLRTSTRGYACGGMAGGGGTIFPNVDRFSFAGEVCVSIATLIQARNFSNGFGNKFNGYIAGGYNNGVGTQNTTNVERFSYASETVAGISAVLSVGGKADFCTWSPSSLSSAYLFSGSSYGRFPDPVNSAFRSYANNKVEKLTYAGEVMSVLGTTLSNGLIGFGTIGNSLRTVIGGGRKPAEAYLLQTESSYAEINQITALSFATDTVEVLATTLSKARVALTGLDNSIT